MTERIAVLGGGNVGHAAAAELAMSGHSVNLFELPQFRRAVETTKKKGGIETTGLLKEFVQLNRVTTNIEEALQEVDIILVTVPAYGVEAFIQACLPHVENGQTLVFFGKGGHTLTAFKALSKLASKKDIVLGETHSALYTARMIGPAQIEIMFRIDLLAAALPTKKTEQLVATLRNLFPSHYFAPAQNVLTTLMCDLNAQLHPPWILFNVARIGPAGEFFLTDECAAGRRSPIGEIVMTAVEKERLTTMQALNLQPVRITDIPRLARGKPIGEKDRKTLEERRKSWRTRVGVKGLERRYLAEDVPYGLVTIASIARMVGVQTPTIEAEITLASLVHQTNYWRKGRTTKSLGIDGLSVDELNMFVNEGIYPK